MSDKNDNEVVPIPLAIKEGMQIYVSFLTANFSFPEEIDHVAMSQFRETITDSLFDTQHLPIMERNNVGITGNDLFNAACILMTEMLYNYVDGDILQAQEVLQEMGMVLVSES